MIDYSTVTEITGYQVSSEQIRRLYTRYRFASDYCSGKEVLEVACGSGQGLGYLAKKAKHVVGGDYDVKIVDIAKKHYKDRFEIKQIDAHNLPYPDNSFDVVIMYEAIYYLSNPEKFILEAKRVLKKEGILIIGTANKEWPGFNPSPYSYKYHSASELHSLIKERGFDVQMFADCPAGGSGNVKDAVLSFIKQTAVKLHLIPKTMKGKEILKRLFFGKLRSLPPEITDDMAAYISPVVIQSEMAIPYFKVLFAVGRKNTD